MTQIALPPASAATRSGQRPAPSNSPPRKDEAPPNVTGGVRAADDTVGEWLTGLVTGEGNSPSQIIVAGILGVVPGIGQAMDLRDIVRDLIALTRAPGNPTAWLDMVITLVGCVPAVGDAIKTVFRLLRRGDALPRILDGLSPAIRGNVERFFRQMDWGQIRSTVKGSFDKTLGAFIDGLDTWVVRSVVGRQEVRLIVEQLQQLRKTAPKKLDEALDELEALWRKALADATPGSTHMGTPARAPTPTATLVQAAPGARSVRRDRSGSPPATPDKARPEQRRAARKKSKPFRSGVPGEHMADYWVKQNKSNLKKANNMGRLWEEWDREGRQGIDHVWVQSGNTDRPGVIGETKSSLLGQFRFLAALPANIRDQLSALSQDEASNPTPSGTPNIFNSEGRDQVASRVKIGQDDATEVELKRGLGKTKTRGVQMSHRWIFINLSDESLTEAGRVLARSVQRAYELRAINGFHPPYARWLLMVTGRQKQLHEKKQGHQHKISPPLIPLPDSILME